jgi:putative IMPACT (imprinted ancient) family translation regulator
VCRQVLQELYENKKIAHATHNMYAYRIWKEDTKCFIQDCNDDGETRGGSRLLHLLQVLELKNLKRVFENRGGSNCLIRNHTIYAHRHMTLRELNQAEWDG